MSSHNELAKLLAKKLVRPECMVWEDVPMGKAGSVRPDVFTLEKSFTQPKPTSYEIKVSRTDLLSDLTSGKWQKYLEFSDAVVFAMPQGLAVKTELPERVGLMLFNQINQTWRTVKKPILSGESRLSNEMLMKLLIGGEERQTKHSDDIAPRKATEWFEQDKLRKVFGQQLAEIMRIKNSLDELDSLTRIRSELYEVLEIPVDTPLYRVGNRIYQLGQQAKLVKSGISEQVLQHLDQVRRNIELAMSRVEKDYQND